MRIPLVIEGWQGSAFARSGPPDSGVRLLVKSCSFIGPMLLATLEVLFGLKPLTPRDTDANHLLQLIPPAATARTGMPKSLPHPAPVAASPRITPAQQIIDDQQPLPERGNLIGFLAIMAKTDLEMPGGTPAEGAAIQARVQAIKTRGEARAYRAGVLTCAEAARPRMRATAVRRIFRT